jgi:VanZ family protein
LALAALLIKRPNTYFWHHFSNALHVLVSFALGLLALRLSRLLLSSFRGYWTHYLVACAAVLGLGGLFEIGQFFTRIGTAALSDVLTDGLGGIAGLVMVLSLDPRLPLPLSRPSVGRCSIRLASLAFLGLGLLSSLTAMRNIILHRAQFPLLASFEHPWEAAFVKVGEGEQMSFVPPPSGFTRAHGKQVAKLVFINTGRRPPRLDLAEISGDWSSFSSLDFEVYLPPDQPPMKIKLRLLDDEPKGYDNHFKLILDLKPGDNSFSMPRELIRTGGGSNHPMHLEKIQDVELLIEPPPRPVTLFFDNFRLVR